MLNGAMVRVTCPLKLVSDLFWACNNYTKYTSVLLVQRIHVKIALNVVKASKLVQMKLIT